MKKLLLTLVVAMTSLAASAQAYLGGEVGFWRSTDDNTTTLSIQPEIGYSFSDKWAVGAALGYTYGYNGLKSHAADGTHNHAINVDPYARYSYAKLGPVSLFLDMGFGICSEWVKDGDGSDVAWRIGLHPGVKVNVAKNLDFVAHVGFLGYRDVDGENSAYGNQGFGFNVDGNNLSFGLYYNF